jgi:hypothetical protein
MLFAARCLLATLSCATVAAAESTVAAAALIVAGGSVLSFADADLRGELSQLRHLRPSSLTALQLAFAALFLLAQSVAAIPYLVDPSALPFFLLFLPALVSLQSPPIPRTIVF